MKAEKLTPAGMAAAMDYAETFLEEHEFSSESEARLVCHALVQQAARVQLLAKALRRLRDCDWVISLPDRMDAVRDIAAHALAEAGLDNET